MNGSVFLHSSYRGNVTRKSVNAQFPNGKIDRGEPIRDVRLLVRRCTIIMRIAYSSNRFSSFMKLTFCYTYFEHSYVESNLVE